MLFVLACICFIASVYAFGSRAALESNLTPSYLSHIVKQMYYLHADRFFLDFELRTKNLLINLRKPQLLKQPRKLNLLTKYVLVGRVCVLHVNK